MSHRSKSPKLTPHMWPDPADADRPLRQAHEAAIAGRRDTGTRNLISESWRRSLLAGVDTEIRNAPLVWDRDTIGDARSAHPFARHLPVLRGTLQAVADQTEHMMVITDADGHVLWSEGPPVVRRAAERVGLMDGFWWSERVVGTNGIGTALTEAAPAYVYSAEHLVRVFQEWSCAGAPITDPDSGKVIGCVDVSARARSLHPAAVALVSATARLTEAQLALEMNARDELLSARYLRHLQGLGGEPAALATATGRIFAAEPAEWRGLRVAVPETGGPMTLPDGRPALAEALGDAFLLRPRGRRRDGRRRGLLTLSLLGASQPYARLNGRRIPLSLRHAEILTLLSLHPEGLSGDQLLWRLYGDDGNPVTVRAEIHRLRAQLGEALRAKPYRLECDVDADFLTVRRALAAGELATAARLYRGPLLPRSDAPAIRSESDELTVQLRSQLLSRGEPDALWTYAQTESGRDDLEVIERLASVLSPEDPRRASAELREHRLLLPE
jgi:hypothetical protein